MCYKQGQGKCKGPEGCAFKARVAAIGDPGVDGS